MKMNFKLTDIKNEIKNKKNYHKAQAGKSLECRNDSATRRTKPGGNDCNFQHDTGLGSGANHN